MLRGLLRSTVARLVAAIFALQIFSGLAAMLLLQSQMRQVIASDRRREILDLRDDLIGTYYQGGYAALAADVAQRRGGAGDPLIFVAVVPVTPDRGKPVLSHLLDLPVVPDSAQPVPVSLGRGAGAPPAAGVATATRLSDGSRLIVGASTAPDRRFQVAFAEAITLTIVLTGLLALSGALLVGYVISRRTHAIAETAEALAAGNFAARVRSEDTGDGFDHLRRQMNHMAERIGRLVRELQAVSSALAHDLRSPVARLRAAVERAQREVDDGPGAEALQLVRADADALEGMVSAALELSRLESGAVSDRRVPLDLADLANDLLELYEPLAEQAGVEVEAVLTPVEVLGDRELLSRALANLIDNALKYGGDRIRVSVQRHGPSAVLSVSDNGPGIAPDDRNRAVERFTRLENARTSPGVGLGLATVGAVAQLHGGTLDLSGGDFAGGAAGRGLLARLTMPAL